MSDPLAVALLTREYPPDVYGGAGVHVDNLARELRKRVEVGVHCWGEPRDEPGVVAHQAWSALAEPMPEAAALQALSIDLTMAAGVRGQMNQHRFGRGNLYLCAVRQWKALRALPERR